jgi:hypothetical protein
MNNGKPSLPSKFPSLRLPRIHKHASVQDGKSLVNEDRIQHYSDCRHLAATCIPGHRPRRLQICGDADANLSNCP